VKHLVYVTYLLEGQVRLSYTFPFWIETTKIKHIKRERNAYKHPTTLVRIADSFRYGPPTEVARS
jgi:hypothetical protein